MNRHASILMLLLLASFASAEEYTPGWLESWEGNQTGVLYNFWHSLNPFVSPQQEVGPYDNADVYGWYGGSFFGLANWEREVCLLDLSGDIQNLRTYSAAETDPTIYTTTLTVAAKREMLYNTSIYEVSWYIRPTEGGYKYRVYLTNNQTKEFFAGRDGSTDASFVSIGTSGASGYQVRYSNFNLTYAVIEYRDPAGNGRNISASVKNK